MDESLANTGEIYHITSDKGMEALKKLATHTISPSLITKNLYFRRPLTTTIDKEKEKIAKEVVELEKKISELKLKLNLGDKTDYKSQKKREV